MVQGAGAGALLSAGCTGRGGDTPWSQLPTLHHKSAESGTPGNCGDSEPPEPPACPMKCCQRHPHTNDGRIITGEDRHTQKVYFCLN